MKKLQDAISKAEARLSEAREFIIRNAPKELFQAIKDLASGAEDTSDAVEYAVMIIARKNAALASYIQKMIDTETSYDAYVKGRDVILTPITNN